MNVFLITGCAVITVITVGAWIKMVNHIFKEFEKIQP